MMISIIIPVHNAGAFLETAIRSVLAQLYRDYELVVVDDHSSDDSLSICTKYAMQDARIKVLSSSGQGVAMARNYGVDHALGEFVTFIDADDWVDENYLSTLGKHMRHNGLVMSGHVREYETHQVPISFVSGGWEKAQENRLLHQGYVWGKLFSLSLIREKTIRFIEGMSIHEDHCFFLDYLLACDEICFCSEITYHYRRGVGETLSSRHHPWSEMVCVSKRLLSRLNAVEQNKNIDLSPADWSNAYYHYGLAQLLRGIRSLYIDASSALQRRWYFRHIIRTFTRYPGRYQPKVMMLVYGLRMLPFFVLDTLFKFAYKEKSKL